MTSSWLLHGLLAVVMVVEGVAGAAAGTNSNLTQAMNFLELYERQSQVIRPKVSEKHWIYNTNITAENQRASVNASLQLAEWKKKMADMAAQFNTAGFPAIIKRRFAKIMDIGTSILNDTSKLEKLKTVLADMQTVYSTAKVCLDCNECVDALHTIATSRDEKLLREVWKGWRDATGKKMKQLYTQYVTIENEAARKLGYPDMGAYWRSDYEMDNFEEVVAALFKELKPLYQQLHAFVRRRLKTQYGETVFPASGHIPAHLLGNMWAQTFTHLQDLVMPFPDKPLFDATPYMKKQNYTVRKIFETAEDFFVSVGLYPMPATFWTRSMLEKPKDGRRVVCHASAWDFRDRKDVRIKMCTKINMDSFRTAHHEMGHVEYYLSYKTLPVEFRRGGNPGFHEAVGDTMALSVVTPQHLHKVGLLPTVEEDKEADLNFLMYRGLKPIAFLPFGYLVDLWRWSVFSGKTTPSTYNQDWWKLRCKLQGISPPVRRTEDDFDPGAKFHIPDDTPYIRYFVRTVIMFQFHKALCEAAGHQGPLHTCDIYKSTAAGDKLKALLSKGSSEVWTIPFKALTGQTKMSVQPLMEYFQPLMDYLKEANKNDTVGWIESACPMPSADSSPRVAVTCSSSSTSSSSLLILGMMLTIFFFKPPGHFLSYCL